MRKIFFIVVIFTQILSLTANAQQSGALIPAIQDRLVTWAWLNL